MIEEGVTTASFMALQDPYGEGLLQYSTEPFADSGGEIVDSFTYDPQAAEFSAEVDRVVSGDPEALVIIGFEETSKILTSLFEAGFTPASRQEDLPGRRQRRQRTRRAAARRVDGRHPGHAARPLRSPVTSRIVSWPSIRN